MTVQKPVKPKASSPGTSVALQRFFMKVHIVFYQRTGGVIGGNLAGHPMLLLTTVGRKTQQERLTPIAYYRDGERFILIASNGGAQKHPIWWLNLQAHPQARVQVGAKIIPVTASEAQGEELQRLWSEITAKFSNFQSYQEKTERMIPVVILTPQS